MTIWILIYWSSLASKTATSTLFAKPTYDSGINASPSKIVIRHCLQKAGRILAGRSQNPRAFSTTHSWATTRLWCCQTTAIRCRGTL
jgi:hypothetical protein